MNNYLDTTKLAPLEVANPFQRRGDVLNWFSHKTNTLWLGGPETGDHFASLASHEDNGPFFFLHAATPYGVILDELAMIQN